MLLCPRWHQSTAFPEKKSASFSTLKDTIYSLADVHSVADVISLVSNEPSVDTGAVFQEDVAKSTIDGSLSIANLEPLDFLTSSNKVVKIDDVSDLKNRPDIISFFSCSMCFKRFFRQHTCYESSYTLISVLYQTTAAPIQR